VDRLSRRARPRRADVRGADSGTPERIATWCSLRPRMAVAMSQTRENCLRAARGSSTWAPIQAARRAEFERCITSPAAFPGNCWTRRSTLPETAREAIRGPNHCETGLLSDEVLAGPAAAGPPRTREAVAMETGMMQIANRVSSGAAARVEAELWPAKCRTNFVRRLWHGHRHQPEIEQQLRGAPAAQVQLTSSPTGADDSRDTCDADTWTRGGGRAGSSDSCMSASSHRAVRGT